MITKALKDFASNFTLKGLAATAAGIVVLAFFQPLAAAAIAAGLLCGASIVAGIYVASASETKTAAVTTTEQAPVTAAESALNNAPALGQDFAAKAEAEKATVLVATPAVKADEPKAK